MAAAQLEAPDNGGMAPCVEEADDYPEEDMEGEEAGDFPVQLGATYCCRRADGSYRDGEVVKLRMNKRAGREEYLIHYAGCQLECELKSSEEMAAFLVPFFMASPHRLPWDRLPQ